jgi:tetratricopeptide (TPR) repeat protein
MRKKIFLSSVFRTMRRVRRAVHDYLENDYEVWWAEEDPRLQNLSSDSVEANNLTRTICLNEVESSDIYLGIFPTRYGSYPFDLAFTEMEYNRALFLDRPRLLYQMRNRYWVDHDQKSKQRTFLHMLKDPEITSIRPVWINSLPALLERISRDLDKLNDDNQAFSSPLWSAPAIQQIQKFQTPNIYSFEDMSFTEATDHLRRVAARSLPEGAVTGLSIAQKFLNKPRWNDRQFLDDFDEFLEAWSYVATWAGVTGPFGQTNVSKIRIRISQMMGDFPRVYELAGGVASALYSDRKLHDAKRWYEVYKRDEVRKRKIPFLLSPLELAFGNVSAAKSAAFEVITSVRNPDNHALYLAYYGLCLVLEKNHRDGFRHLREAIETPRIAPSALTRVYRSASRAYQYIGDTDAALEYCDLAEQLAQNNYLAGQMKKAQRQRRSIVNSVKVNNG